MWLVVLLMTLSIFEQVKPDEFFIMAKIYHGYLLSNCQVTAQKSWTKILPLEMCMGWRFCQRGTIENLPTLSLFKKQSH